MSAQNDILLEAGTNELEIVEFYLEEDPRNEKPNGHRAYYGVNVAKVLEIIRMPEVTEMPEVTHPAVLGAFDLRSRIIPLLDLAAWLKKKRVENEPPKVIVTEFNNVTSAFMVSGVTRIHRISWEDVEAPNKYVSALSSESITGVVKFRDRMVFILDLERIVAELNPKLRLKLDENVAFDVKSNYRALIADDSPLIREMIRDLLQQAGFHVEKTNNGRECWDRLQEIKQSAMDSGRPVTDFVQVVISDIEMPMMDGHNLTKRIKEDLALRDLPVILFSSIITDKLRHKGESVGADDQCSKPEITQLALRAANLIEGRETEAQDEG
ncbi:chemotaxis protein [Pseudodesulfovibrio senegalensis]|jgi:two-component system chemotaxis response regulator CheV|uniref:Chemotaxis protein CheV n=1 Tax=Pseudodesulfovibrio senegalensis TaxID=1721087 RepID=A0A6N6N487_9BACT|nr:chemotaxis protein [Pseudodesulfovibrio senegalensis]KAB1442310.1 chemotaxis protein CheV [Pseudodesulfovibrio senegalensis]